MKTIEESITYKIAYRSKVTGNIIGYSSEFDTVEIAKEMLNKGSNSTKEVETFIIKETVKRESI